ncbi:NAD(P)-dependent oxidoreductase [Chloroflexus sp.]|uniref:NAD(P)H-dependent oxidoreductase n=1 Tax=Chloroflexus sp. TaxID=1904827 RepID=UPI002ADE3D70|nr:NAD(P)-dependent oxidoreductase [Chloroflexus sp.]
MILIDTALQRAEAENRPIRVGMVGAGFMARGIALQIIRYTRGMRLVAIANRTLERAVQAYTEADVPSDAIRYVDSPATLAAALAVGAPVVTDDALLLCAADGIDVILEVTGAVEFGAQVAVTAMRHGKHVVTMNAELDGTLGAILQVYARRHGVIFTLSDGDQPGVTMNLYRFVRGLGVKPVLCGNIKGLHDPYRNPTTQANFARQWGQNPYMVTSFADGTKISFEQAVVANATGMRVAKRGMFGPTVPSGTPLADVVHDLYPLEAVLDGPGIVDYVVGATPGPGVFVLGTHDHPRMQHYLNLYKLGKGPLYLFYTPYHLCHFEVPNSVARAALFGDTVLAAAGRPMVEVITAAKTDLYAGQTLDGLGGYMTYGLAENADVVQAERLLPIGLAEGCTLLRDIPKDGIISYADVQLPANRLSDQLRAEQDALFWAENR